jgi:cell division protein FtsL
MIREKKKKPIISIIIILLILVWIGFFSEYSWFRRYRLQNKLEDVQKQIAELEQQNANLQRENELLRNDPATWEREARNLGMQKEGENVFIFQEQED